MTSEKLHILSMLRGQRGHVSFHTPGHKRGGADITELSYSDNLGSPHGAIARAQEDIARILGADKSFILTDGSTAGVFAMLYTLRLAGLKSVAVPAFSHASVFHACEATGLGCIVFGGSRSRGIPLQPTAEELSAAVEQADALLITSPDYYGFFPPLSAARELCNGARKPLLIDGAHGSHLHGTPLHAGVYADMWVDGAHKSLPALTQGAVVSARGAWAERLESALVFRTSSPSYPIMASVEYAIKYPANEKIQALSEAFKRAHAAVGNDDWSKILIAFGDKSAEAQSALERSGIFAEFNDGNYLMFYLSPCTKPSHLKKLARAIEKLPRGEIVERVSEHGKRGHVRVWVPLNKAVGRTCAVPCGLFPPCVPLVSEGEIVSAEACGLLAGGQTFGLKNGAICVYEGEE